MNEPTIYAEAIEVIYRLGWTQGELLDAGTGSVCITGALNTACHGTPMPCVVDRHDHFADGWFEGAALDAVIGCGSVEAWNDAPERAVEDVILLLKYADAGELQTWRGLYGS